MVELMGFDIFSDSKEIFIEDIIRRIKNNEKTAIISGNLEVLYNLNKSDSYIKIKKTNGIIVPDGIGVILLSRMLGIDIKEKIAGIEVVDDLLSLSDKNGYTFYFLGAHEDVLLKSVRNVENKYSARIVGMHHGYFNIDDCRDIIDEINLLKPDILLAAMGCPKQEGFIFNYFKELNTCIMMGVGGTFDILSGEKNRAPKWMIKLGLEWVYRIIKEPKRIKRLHVVPLFIVRTIIYHTKKYLYRL